MIGRVVLLCEILVLSALILAARCANYRDVFVAGEIYFTDADCYARMTRVRVCAQHPLTIVRHHDFENYPAGIRPHTTAPFDYAILALAAVLRPVTDQWLDLAGAIISPLLALFGGWFLWWWARVMQFRFRMSMLLLYAISPILVHGSELGRPDHQSLLMLLVSVGLGAELVLQTNASRNWSVASGAAWSLALWVSLYEPLLLFLIILLCYALLARDQLTAPHRRAGWLGFAVVILLMIGVERRIPGFPVSLNSSSLKNWAAMIGELRQTRINDPIWLHWTGYFIPLTTILLCWAVWFKKQNRPPVFMLLLFALTLSATLWQTRWAYFFVLVLAMMLPACLSGIQGRWLGGLAIIVAFVPILQSWDETLWPNEGEIVRRNQERAEMVQLRELATRLRSNETEPFLAPWWFSPSICYWSGQPGVAGSSHEGLDGIAESARFFATSDISVAQQILERRRVRWVVAIDAENTVENSAAILGIAQPAHPLARVLTRTPGQAPLFLTLVAENGAGKVYRVGKKPGFPSQSH